MVIASVVIPVFNSEKYLTACIKSVLGQTLNDLECILVNDASTDQSLDMAKAFAREDKRIRIVNLRANSGACTARNVGLRLAKGKYICFLDSDDLFMPQSLEMRIKAVDNHDDPYLIGSFCHSASISEDQISAPSFHSSHSANPKRTKDYVTELGRCPFNANQPLFITNRLLGTVGFDEQLAQQGEDYEYWLRIFRLGYFLVQTNATLVCYRSRPGSTVRKEPLTHLENSLRWQAETLTEYVDSETSFAFNQSCFNYWLQLDGASRIFTFAGMALASGESLQCILSELVKNLPHYKLFIYRHKDALDLIQQGIRRQLAIDTIPSSLQQSAYLLYEQFDKACSRFTPAISGCGDLWQYRNKRVTYAPKVAFLPHKDYHLWTIQLICDELKVDSREYVVVDLSSHYRDEGVRRKASELGVNLVGFSNWLLSDSGPDTLVCFNDWDPIVRSLVKCAQLAGLKTVAIVEGIQDYLDADTKQSRFAYKSCDHIFLPGNFDRKYFRGSSQEIDIIGVPRVRSIFQKHVHQKSIGRGDKKVLINSNFTYGVLEEHRDAWLSSVVDACLRSNYVPVISRHPADSGSLYAEHTSKQSFYEELGNCKVYISRFASGILESLAAGLNVIYYNPSIEKVDKFAAPNGAYECITSHDDLVRYLLHGAQDAEPAAVVKFLENHCGDLRKGNVDTFGKLLEKTSHSYRQWQNFRNNVKALDQKTNCFTNIEVIREGLSASYAGGGCDLADIEQFLGVGDNPSESFANSKNRLVQANKLYRSGRFKDALAIYESLAKSEFYSRMLIPNIKKCRRRLGGSF